MTGVLVLKNGGNPPFFCAFLACDGRFGVSFVAVCGWGVGLCRCVVVVGGFVFLCDVLCGRIFGE